MDERVEKEFLSTQEETLTSIPEDPETEAELIDELPNDESKCEESQSAQLSSSTSATATCTTTNTNVEQTRQTITDYLIENPYKPSGKLAVGNGSAIFHNQLKTKASSTDDVLDDDDKNNNNDEKIKPNGWMITPQGDLEDEDNEDDEIINGDQNEKSCEVEQFEHKVVSESAEEIRPTSKTVPTVENNNLSGMYSKNCIFQTIFLVGSYNYD